MERPRASICISTHLEATRPLVTTDPYPDTIHDFSGMAGNPIDAAPADDATTLDKWLADTVATGANEKLADYRRQAPHADRNHPYPVEHILPLLVAAGPPQNPRRDWLVPPVCLWCPFFGCLPLGMTDTTVVLQKRYLPRKRSPYSV